MAFENPFKRSTKEQEEADKKLDQHVSIDKQGVPHLAATEEEALQKMREANEGMK